MRVIPKMLLFMMILTPFALADSPPNTSCFKQECC